LARLADSIGLVILGKMWTSGNTVLIPDFPEPYTICEGNLNIPRSVRKNVRLIGPILPKHPDELSTKEELRGKLGLPLDRPVIFVPISGPTLEKAFVTSVLRKVLLEFPEEYEIVVSYGYPGADSKPVRHGNVTIYKWVPNRFEYLKACDVVIGRAFRSWNNNAVYVLRQTRDTRAHTKPHRTTHERKTSTETRRCAGYPAKMADQRETAGKGSTMLAKGN
jgi:hypothetical protein